MALWTPVRPLKRAYHFAALCKLPSAVPPCNCSQPVRLSDRCPTAPIQVYAHPAGRFSARDANQVLYVGVPRCPTHGHCCLRWGGRSALDAGGDSWVPAALPAATVKRMLAPLLAASSWRPAFCGGPGFDSGMKSASVLPSFLPNVILLCCPAQRQHTFRLSGSLNQRSPPFLACTPQPKRCTKEFRCKYHAHM